MTKDNGTDKDIYQALNEVMKEVGYVQKTRSKGISYSYAGEVALIKAIRPHFLKHGIVIHPHEVQKIHQDSYITSNKKTMNRATVVITYRIAHAPSGSSIDVSVTGEGADVGDKTFNKALTGAYKYALRQTLMIETGDDPDKFPSDPEDTSAANGNVKSNGSKLMSSTKFVQYVVDKLGYENDNHVRATMKLFGFNAVPNDPDKRKLLYQSLEAYRGHRGRGLTQADALAAVEGEK